MAEPSDTEKPNGEPSVVDVTEDDGETINGTRGAYVYPEGQSLFAALRRLISDILSPDYGTSASFLHRVKISVAQNGPSVREALRNTSRDVLNWTRRGSPLRALLVISVGTIALLALTGLLIFMFFFLAATVNAIIISLLMSLVAAGGFLALFFAFVTAIYIGALSVAVFVISTSTIGAILAVLIATGWVGFFLLVWLVTRKSFGLAKRSLSVTGSALSAYSSVRHARHANKVSD